MYALLGGFVPFAFFEPSSLAETSQVLIGHPPQAFAQVLRVDVVLGELAHRLS